MVIDSTVVKGELRVRIKRITAGTQRASSEEYRLGPSSEAKREIDGSNTERDRKKMRDALTGSGVLLPDY